MARLALALLLCFSMLAVSSLAWAHEFSPAVLSLKELEEPNSFNVEWVAPRLERGSAPVKPRYPQQCRQQGDRLVCGADGLRGELGFDGLEGTNVEVIVQVEWNDGRTLTQTLTGTRPSLDLSQGAGLTGAPLQLAAAYTALGVEHILGGFDHLLFVLGLLLVVGYQKQLIWTITAFTLAHSITLASGAVGFWTLPSRPVETCIALSILLVAAEALHDRPTLTRARPYAVSFGFGLLHGFGFSGALREIGLPAGQVPLALLTFNLGVELGQLLVVGALYLLWLGLRRIQPEHLRVPRALLVYGMGTVAVYWTLERVAPLWAT